MFFMPAQSAFLGACFRFLFKIKTISFVFLSLLVFNQNLLLVRAEKDLQDVFISEIFATGSVVSNGCKKVQSKLENMCSFDKWIEIYNPNDFDFSLDGYRLKVQNGLTEILKNVQIAPKSFLVIDNGNYSRLTEVNEQNSQPNLKLETKSLNTSQNTLKDGLQINFLNNQKDDLNLAKLESTATDDQDLVKNQKDDLNLSRDVKDSEDANKEDAGKLSLDNSQLQDTKKLINTENLNPDKLKTTDSNLAENLSPVLKNDQESQNNKNNNLTAKNTQNTQKQKVPIFTSIEQAGISRFSVGILHALNPQNPKIELLSPTGKIISRSARTFDPQTSIEFENPSSEGQASSQVYLENNKGTPGYGLISEIQDNLKQKSFKTSNASSFKDISTDSQLTKLEDQALKQLEQTTEKTKEESQINLQKEQTSLQPSLEQNLNIQANLDTLRQTEPSLQNKQAKSLLQKQNLLAEEKEFLKTKLEQGLEKELSKEVFKSENLQKENTQVIQTSNFQENQESSIAKEEFMENEEKKKVFNSRQNFVFIFYDSLLNFQESKTNNQKNLDSNLNSIENLSITSNSLEEYLILYSQSYSPVEKSKKTIISDLFNKPVSENELKKLTQTYLNFKFISCFLVLALIVFLKSSTELQRKLKFNYLEFKTELVLPKLKVFPVFKTLEPNLIL